MHVYLHMLIDVDSNTCQASFIKHAGFFHSPDLWSGKAAPVRWQALAEAGSSDMEDTLGGSAPFEAWVRYGFASPPAAASGQAAAHPDADLEGPRSPTGPDTPTPGGGGGAPWDFAQAAAELAPAELVLLCARHQVSAGAAGQPSCV